MQKGFSQLFIILCVLIAIIVIGGVYFLPRLGFNPFVTHSLTNFGNLPNQLIIERPNNLTNLPYLKQTITNLNQIQNLYVLATSYPPAPIVTGTISCPNDHGLMYNLDFLKDGLSILHVVWKPDGCRYLKVGNQLVKYDSIFESTFNQILASIQNESTNSPSSDASNWKTYTNTNYGFSFQHPPDWGIVYEKNNIIEVSSNGAESLEIGVKNSIDKTKITRSDPGVDRAQKRGSIQFLNQPLEKDVFVLNGKDISVFYNNAIEIPRGNLTFTISLINGTPSPAILNSGPPNGVSAIAESISDTILSTFKFTN